MKLERAEAFGVAVPLVGEYKNAYRSKSVQKSAIVRVTAGDGRVGLGNIDPSPGHSKETIEDNLRVLESRLAPAVRERLLFNAWIGIVAPEEAARETLEWKSGIPLPGGPGLGVTLDEAKLAKYRFDVSEAAA